MKIKKFNKNEINKGLSALELNFQNHNFHVNNKKVRPS